jgi:Fe-S oxidoreductase/coenzyme F420-reducing hydrogenase delta subunit
MITVNVNKETEIFEPKILVFACNWCSYAGADNAGVSRIQYSPNVRLLRVMCSGRVHPSFVLKAFAEGSDGVIVSGCHFGDCHYMFGNYRAEEQFKKLKEITVLLGLEPERIALEWISAAEGPRFAEVINDFTDQIRKLGPSPIGNGYNVSLKPIEDLDLKEYHLYECLECGRCTAVCPVAKTHLFSPRRLLSKGISSGINSFAGDSSIWACLTCKLCENVCPTNIPYSELNLAARTISNHLSVEKSCTHGGVFEQISRIMMKSNLKQDRLHWVTDDLKISDESDTVFFTGCSPYFAAYFGEPYSDNLVGSLRAGVKLMNKIGIEPRVLSNEICCGHDLLIRGEIEQFKYMAEKLTKIIKDSKAKRIVFSCPECLVTLRDEYPKYVEKESIELLHISELLEKEISFIEFKKDIVTATYQDPCRLGRYSSIYEQPRKMISAIPGINFVEMSHNNERSICCGNTAWIGCDSGTKEIQKQRIMEAINTDSEQLLTACPKCLIHLTCAKEGDKDLSNNSIRINDIWKFIESHLQ